MTRPLESDYTSQVAYTRALEAYCDTLAQPEQEPVAWGFRHHDGAIYDCISPEAHADCEGEYNVPLYDAPPKRPWVGLMDEDIAYAYTLEKKFAMQYVDAKLRELNT